MKNFWKDLKKPILIQAPMEEVTDTVFRQIIAKCGKPHVFFTEFTKFIFQECRMPAILEVN